MESFYFPNMEVILKNIGRKIMTALAALFPVQFGPAWALQYAYVRVRTNNQ